MSAQKQGRLGSAAFVVSLPVTLATHRVNNAEKMIVHQNSAAALNMNFLLTFPSNWNRERKSWCL